LLTRAVGRHMRAAGGGRIINLNSAAATGPRPLSSAYSASKAALARVTGSTELDGAQHGIHAFDLSPGVVVTDMTRGMTIHRDRTEWTDPADVTEMALAMAEGRLDSWAGRMVQAGADDLDTLTRVAEEGLDGETRTIALRGYGEHDPLV